MDAFLIPLALMLTFVGNPASAMAKNAVVIGPAIFIVGLRVLQHSDSLVFIGFRVLQGIGAGFALPWRGLSQWGIGKQYSDMARAICCQLCLRRQCRCLAAYTTWYLSWRLIYAGLAVLLFSAWVLIIRYMPADRGDLEQKIDWLTFI